MGDIVGLSPPAESCQHINVGLMDEEIITLAQKDLTPFNFTL